MRCKGVQEFEGVEGGGSRWQIRMLSVELTDNAGVAIPGTSVRGGVVLEVANAQQVPFVVGQVYITGPIAAG